MKKIKSKAKRKTNSKPRVKSFSAVYLALVLSLMLLLEGALFGVSTQSMWRDAANLLDVSSGVVETSNDTQLVLQPLINTVSDINKFYQLSATEMTNLLDISKGDVGLEFNWVLDGVSNFYQRAGVQMAEVLDVNSVSTWPAQVAGISISR